MVLVWRCTNIFCSQPTYLLQSMLQLPGVMQRLIRRQFPAPPLIYNLIRHACPIENVFLPYSDTLFGYTAQPHPRRLCETRNTRQLRDQWDRIRTWPILQRRWTPSTLVRLPRHPRYDTLAQTVEFGYHVLVQMFEQLRQHHRESLAYIKQLSMTCRAAHELFRDTEIRSMRYWTSMPDHPMASPLSPTMQLYDHPIYHAITTRWMSVTTTNLEQCYSW